VSETFVMPPIDVESETFVDAQADESERGYALAIHLVGLANAVAIVVLPLFATLIMWRIKADDSPYLDDHGREATNFQLSMATYIVGGGAALGLLGFPTCGVAWALMPVGALALVVVQVIASIRGAQAAYKGQYYRYPMCIRFIPLREYA
jgi:hypothetical protein